MTTARRRAAQHPPELPWDPHTGDIICDRIITIGLHDEGPLGVRQRFNLIQELWIDDEVGFDWGDDSLGSWTFALAILDRFLPARPGDVGYLCGRRLPCHPVAAILTPEYARGYIRHIPFWGCIIRGVEVENWLEGRVDAWEVQGIDLAAEAAADAEERQV